MPATVTGASTTPVTTIGVIATGIIIFVTTKRVSFFMLQLKQQDNRTKDSLTTAAMVFGY